MDFLFSSFLAASAAFIATNIDDIVLLAVFFSQVNQNFRKRHIIIGQILGFFAIVLLSALGFIVGLVIPPAWIALLGFLPIFMGIRQLFSKEDDDDDELDLDENPPSKNFLAAFISPHSYAVALITIANGGDNIGIYIPFFAAQSALSFLITLVVFALLTVVLLYLGYLLAKQPLVSKSIQNYGQIIVPFVLIALGIYILIEGDAISLLVSFFGAQ